MRGRAAPSNAAQARRISGADARARPAMTGRRISRETAFTASKSSSEAMGNPASMTSAPRRSSWQARRSLSRMPMLHPGACSPSRRVVSKNVIRERSIASLLVAINVQCSGAEIQLVKFIIVLLYINTSYAINNRSNLISGANRIGLFPTGNFSRCGAVRQFFQSRQGGASHPTRSKPGGA